MAQKPKGKRRSEQTPTPPCQVVLCTCGQPITSRHFEVWDCPVSPEGEVFPDGSAHDDGTADKLQRGLFCKRCDVFIRDEDGDPYEYPDVPDLLEQGWLKLGVVA